MDILELRVEKVRNTLRLVESNTQLLAHLYVALIAVAVTAGVTLVAASLAGQIPWSASLLSLGLTGVGIAWSVRRIIGLRRTLNVAYETANRRIDTLIIQEGERRDDDPSPDARGA